MTEEWSKRSPSSAVPGSSAAEARKAQEDLFDLHAQASFTSKRVKKISSQQLKAYYDKRLASGQYAVDPNIRRAVARVTEAAQQPDDTHVSDLPDVNGTQPPVLDQEEPSLQRKPTIPQRPMAKHRSQGFNNPGLRPALAVAGVVLLGALALFLALQ